MFALFLNPNGYFSDTNYHHEYLIVHPSRLEDTPTPSGNALAAEALLLISEYTNESTWRKLAIDLINSVKDMASKYPQYFSYWLCAMDRVLSPSSQVAILGNPSDPLTQSFLQVLWKKYRPNLVVAISKYPPSDDSPPLLKIVNRSIINLLHSYVTISLACNQPQMFRNFANRLISLNKQKLYQYQHRHSRLLAAHCGLN